MAQGKFVTYRKGSILPSASKKKKKKSIHHGSKTSLEDQKWQLLEKIEENTPRYRHREGLSEGVQQLREKQQEARDWTSWDLKAREAASRTKGWQTER